MMTNKSWLPRHGSSRNTMICGRLFCCNSPFRISRIICVKEPSRVVGCIRLLLFATLVSFLAVLVILFTGNQLEERHVQRLSGTSQLYNTSRVCALVIPPTYEDLLQRMNRNNNHSRRNHTITNNTRNITNITALAATFVNLYYADMNTTAGSFHSSGFPPLPPITSETFNSIDETTSYYDDHQPNSSTSSSTSSSNNNNESILVAHCGSCGSCSNPHDIAIYAATANTLTATTTKCAAKSILGGRKAASECMKLRVGFTPACQECWVDNIVCDFRLCVFSCLWHRTFPGTKVRRQPRSPSSRFSTTTNNTTNSTTTSNNKNGYAISSINNNDKHEGSHPLDPCQLCDEKRCGPAFLQCAGANRRRSGIVSDLERVSNQVCKSLPQPRWWQSPTLQAYFDASTPTPTSGTKQWPFRR